MLSDSLLPSSSAPVVSNQAGIHPQLKKIVNKHLSSHFQCPISDTQKHQFDRAWNWLQLQLQQQQRPFIIDCGCGTGMSSFLLAQQHPDKLIIGIDQSSHRLRNSARYTAKQRNLYYIQARLEEFWLLALKADLHPDKQFLFYPNPWPKHKHLRRRWHGHPIFPVILKLCDKLELRTNWSIYAKEFHFALSLGGIDNQLLEYRPQSPISRFELKYGASQHPLFRVLS